MTKKSSKEISKLISQLMQDHKLDRHDLSRGLVVLDNLEKDYSWNNGIMKTIDKPVKTIKLKKEAVLAETCIS